MTPRVVSIESRRAPWRSIALDCLGRVRLYLYALEVAPPTAHRDALAEILKEHEAHLVSVLNRERDAA